MPEMTMRDAAVALRSFPRRYRELLAGPRGDDTWDRLVRTVAQPGGRSALGWAHHTAQAHEALGAMLRSVPTTARPSLSLRAVLRSPEPPADASIDDVLGELATNAVAAAEALDARQASDADRKVDLDGNERTLQDVVALVVDASARHLRDIATALDSARSMR